MNDLEKFNILIREGTICPLGGNQNPILQFSPKLGDGTSYFTLQVEKFDIDITQRYIDIPDLVNEHIASLEWENKHVFTYYFEAFYSSKLQKAQYINVNGSHSEDLGSRYTPKWLIFDDEEGYSVIDYSSGLRLVTLVCLCYKPVPYAG